MHNHGAQAGLTVAVAAPAIEPWRKDANLAAAERVAVDAANAGADLLVLCEGFVEGWVVEHPEVTAARFLDIAEPADGPAIRRLAGICRELGIWMVAGFAEREGEQVYNSAAVIDREGRLAGVYRKTHLRGHDAERRLYAEGNELPVFETEFGPVGIMICYDRQVPEVARVLRLGGARLLLVPSNGGFGERNEVVVRARAYENAAFLVFSHPHEGLVVDPRGHVIARKGVDEELVIRKVDLSDADRCLAVSPGGRTILTRRPELYRALVDPDGPH